MIKINKEDLFNKSKAIIFILLTASILIFSAILIDYYKEILKLNIWIILSIGILYVLNFLFFIKSIFFTYEDIEKDCLINGKCSILEKIYIKNK